MNAQIEQRTPEWLDARIGRITGSRIAAVLGRDPYRSRVALLKEMAAEAMGKRVERDSPAMTWGREQEAKALDDFALLNCGLDDDLQPGGWFTLGDNLGFSPDAVVRNRSLLVEIKCPYSGTLPAEPYAYHIDQVQLGMHVLGLDEAAIHYWTPNNSETFFLPRDPVWLEAAMPAVYDFLSDYRKALLEPETWLAEERSDSEWAEAAQEWRLAKAAYDAIKERLNRATVALEELSAGNPAFGRGVRVTWVERKGNVAWPKLAADYHITEEQQDAYRSKSTRYARVASDE